MITAVIITLNEEENIAACIQSVVSVCSECIIVDAESTDKTVQIAQQLEAKVYSKKWSGYGEARNYGASLAQNRWILSIDADERLSPELSKKLSLFPQKNNTIYRFNRLTQYCGQWIKHGAWHPEWKSKLYHRHYYKWDDRPVHEDLIPLQGQTKKSKIKGLLLHEAYKTHQEFEKKLDHYALLYSKGKDSKSPLFNLLKQVFSPKYHFLKSFFWKKGFLDGRAGFKIAKAIESYHRKKLAVFS